MSRPSSRHENAGCNAVDLLTWGNRGAVNLIRASSSFYDWTLSLICDSLSRLIPTDGMLVKPIATKTHMVLMLCSTRHHTLLTQVPVLKESAVSHSIKFAAQVPNKASIKPTILIPNINDSRCVNNVPCYAQRSQKCFIRCNQMSYGKLRYSQ